SGYRRRPVPPSTSRPIRDRVCVAGPVRADGRRGRRAVVGTEGSRSARPSRMLCGRSVSGSGRSNRVPLTGTARWTSRARPARVGDRSRATAAKPRLAVRQPNAAWGAPGEDRAVRQSRRRQGADPRGPARPHGGQVSTSTVLNRPVAPRVADAPVSTGPDPLQVLDPPTVPLVDGGRVGYANFDYAASAPCLRAASEAVNEILPRYTAVH